MLPALQVSSDSASPPSHEGCKEHAETVFSQLKVKRRGKFFPSLSSNPSASSITTTTPSQLDLSSPPQPAATASNVKTEKDEISYIELSDDDIEERVVDDGNFAGGTQGMEVDTPAGTHNNNYGGARPKTNSGHRNTHRSKHGKQKHSLKHSSKSASKHSSVLSTGSDSDSLLSPPKRTKASFMADDRKLARRNLLRAESESHNTPPSPISVNTNSSPHSPLFSSIPPTTQQQVSPELAAINWDSPMTPAASHHRPQQPQQPLLPDYDDDDHSAVDDDSSDMDDDKWERFVHEMSRPYINMSGEKKTSPSQRIKKKARRRSNAVSAATRSSRGGAGDGGNAIINSSMDRSAPCIIITEPTATDTGATMTPQSQSSSFHLSPSISFTSLDQGFSFTGGRQSSGDGNPPQVNSQTFTVQAPQTQNTRSNDTTDGAGSSRNATIDSPLANMITDMAIQDVDFETEITPPQPQRSTTARTSPFFPTTSLDTSSGQWRVYSPPRATTTTTTTTSSAAGGPSFSIRPARPSRPSRGASSSSSLSQPSRRSSGGRKRRWPRTGVSCQSQHDMPVLVLGSDEESGVAAAATTRRRSGHRNITQIESDEQMARRLQVRQLAMFWEILCL